VIETSKYSAKCSGEREKEAGCAVLKIAFKYAQAYASEHRLKTLAE